MRRALGAKSLYDDNALEDLHAATDDLTPGELFGGITSVADFEYGLCDAGITNTNVSNPQTVEEVNDTSTMTS
jgi:hypothetical protein